MRGHIAAAAFGADAGSGRHHSMQRPKEQAKSSDQK
jgi:hypothetical protein